MPKILPRNIRYSRHQLRLSELISALESEATENVPSEDWRTSALRVARVLRIALEEITGSGVTRPDGQE